MCNLYAQTKPQDALRRAFEQIADDGALIEDLTGNLGDGEVGGMVSCGIVSVTQAGIRCAAMSLMLMGGYRVFAGCYSCASRLMDRSCFGCVLALSGGFLPRGLWIGRDFAWLVGLGFRLFWQNQCVNNFTLFCVFGVRMHKL